MATHSTVLAWVIPETEEPGGLESTESQRVEHDLSDSRAAATREIYRERMRRPPLERVTSKSRYGGDRIRAKCWLLCRTQMAAGAEG